MAMNEYEIFERLFRLIEDSVKISHDTTGSVASCLVRDGNVLIEEVSTLDGRHAEYMVLEKARILGITLDDDDVMYTTVEPCGKRTPGGPGEKYGDCTTNLIRSGIKRVVFAAAYDASSGATRHKFADADVALEQVSDTEVVLKAVESFNSTQANPSKRLPRQ